MKKNKKELKNIRFPWLYVIVALFVFGFIYYRVFYITTNKYVDDIDLQTFAKNRTTKKEILSSKRGTIYDSKGNPLAQNVSSYTLIANLDPTKTTNPNKPQHVVDIEDTAKKLSPILDISEEQLVRFLSKYNPAPGGTKQVEFGSKGRGLTELKKDEILRLNLPGLGFIETQQRYYPYGNFLSYTIGYAKKKEVTKEDGTTSEDIVGEMGMELYNNDTLTGENGYTYYQKDRNGYKIAGTKEIVVPATDGKDIYLTIDSTIQLFVEQAANDMLSKSKADFISLMLADAKTGAILASYTYPSFNPNKRDISSYLDINTQSPFEPGSTMKIWSYLAAMEKGVYNGQEKYKSGIFTAKDGTVMGDYDRKGWGMITYDKGFALSSNTAVMNLVSKYIGADYLKGYYNKLGFGNKTGIELPNEASGKIAFRYETEILNAAFGQGITTTPIQNVKALTSIANGGILLEPYIIDKILDSKTGEVVYKGERKEIERVATKENVEKIKTLMRSVITGTAATCTGYYYNLPGYDFIGKTGTAQVAGPKGYSNETIAGLAGMFPGDDPQVILYMAIKNPTNGTKPRKEFVQSIIKNVSKYLEIYDESKNSTVKLQEVNIENYTNKSVETVKGNLSSYGINVITIGNGDKITNQYPKAGTKVNSIDKVFLVTNGNEIKLLNLQGYSMKDVTTYTNLIGLKTNMMGNGYVVTQSIPPDTVLTLNELLELRFTTAPKEETAVEEEKKEG